METDRLPTNPASITDADKRKLIALYMRVCPADVVTADDQRRDMIAAEMMDVGLAASPAAALAVIAWWDPIPENLKSLVQDVRRSFRRLKLEGRYANDGNGLTS